MQDSRDAQMIAPNSDGKFVSRPLSPHLQIYRWPINMSLSILHRVTGVGLTIGTGVLTWWLVAAASTDAAFDRAQWFIGSGPGLLLLFGWSGALIFHFLSGIRHLFWDIGIGFDAPINKASGWFIVFATGAFTAIVWVIGVLV